MDATRCLDSLKQHRICSLCGYHSPASVICVLVDALQMGSFGWIFCVMGFSYLLLVNVCLDVEVFRFVPGPISYLNGDYVRDNGGINLLFPQVWFGKSKVGKHHQETEQP